MKKDGELMRVDLLLVDGKVRTKEDYLLIFSSQYGIWNYFIEIFLEPLPKDRFVCFGGS